MKPTCLVLTTLLLSALISLSFSQSINNPKRCCVTYKSKIKPPVVSYIKTDPECALKAVIFTNRRGARACVNPGKPWVKSIMKKLDKAASSTVSESGSGSGFKLTV
ncbi:hypothetical protein AGOR_G00084420 [Albula goreensis]|uniref:Chemokine interleukin-8-like domain-containing protein n=1 Tax=Albula goreensis TaxID=1534307 RepID=A0A8T3DN12_9TELE|nr:hypothetical protein AGOR_G00084420 [Albula goreensis]